MLKYMCVDVTDGVSNGVGGIVTTPPLQRISEYLDLLPDISLPLLSVTINLSLTSRSRICLWGWLGDIKFENSDQMKKFIAVMK